MVIGSQRGETIPKTSTVWGPTTVRASKAADSNSQASGTPRTTAYARNKMAAIKDRKAGEPPREAMNSPRKR